MHHWSLTGRLETENAKAPSILVIGAGMAGLAAARMLHDSGFDVTIIEARDRIGGRLWTSQQLGAYTDLGASWIHGADHNPLSNWCDRLGIETVITPSDKRHFAVQNRLVEWEELNNLATAGLASVDQRLQGKAAPHTIAELVEPLLQDPTLPLLDRQLLAWMTGLAEGVQAGLAEDLDVRWWQPKELTIVNAMPLGGYRRLVEEVAQGVNVRLNSPVSKIELLEDGVLVHCGEQSERADYGVITVPVGVLQAGQIEFSPPLPAAKQAAIQQIGFGGGVLNKIFIRFPYRFWPDLQDRFIALPARVEERGLFANWINTEPLHGQPILLSFSTGANGAQIDRTSSDAEVYAEAMKSLRRIFGEEIPEAEAYVVTRWLSDPWSRGSYSYARVGVDDVAARAAYAAPVADRLFFAGEATDPDEFGTVHAALLSGEQAACAVYKLATGQEADVSHLPYA
ncbi:MAG: NAD(P)/FAD-dependent oxidoreductase [Caldilineaceae bacterium]